MSVLYKTALLRAQQEDLSDNMIILKRMIRSRPREESKGLRREYIDNANALNNSLHKEDIVLEQKREKNRVQEARRIAFRDPMARVSSGLKPKVETKTKVKKDKADSVGMTTRLNKY